MSTTIMKHDEVYNTCNCMVRLGRAVHFHIMELLVRIKWSCNVDIHVQHIRDVLIQVLICLPHTLQIHD